MLSGRRSKLIDMLQWYGSTLILGFCKALLEGEIGYTGDGSARVIKSLVGSPNLKVTCHAGEV